MVADQTTFLLDSWLGQLYAWHVVKGHSDNVVIDQFKTAMNGNQDLSDAAKARLNSYTDDVLKRDFISRKHKEFLTTALGS